MRMCRDCGQYPVALGADGLCQACEIAHMEDARFLEYVEAAVAAYAIAKGLGLSGDLDWS